ncbi:MAG: 50S ribosomal protein L32 [Rhodobacteraceae bacterium]|nr:50S ribosomal protein L32 [Paracoccaceae bacterium]
MAVQQNKVSPARRNKRRSHDALRAVHVMECPECGAQKRSHHICPQCGMYNGLQVLRVQALEVDEDED